MGDLEQLVRVLGVHDVRLQRLETQEIGIGTSAGTSGGIGTASLNFVFNQGGAVLDATPAVELRSFFAGTIVRWSVVAVPVTSTIRFNVAKATYSSFPTMGNIDGSDPPELGTASKAESTALTGWTTAVANGDVWRVSVDGAVTPLNVTRATVTIEVVAS